ncbi:probable F420-dependent oxidoreductase, Rv2161c family [Actinopolymorpha cephalotaxi]|uniref:F420-dependent oxidoreductase n=1 Tax=Actinopolymorpha cephalotaxi TaxID=504797 RepID=A0A1I2WA75_9ACTN|nr:LLM class F420-dependent oxidoreductase [Actinopolymorpha cephalotaxi]NYH82702.1 putative F420-dependent oxidoreductase [Actinopolymorpha cephalotaxi]SFG97549.1 probable F420-dependent oxidoreductase, Rv2161c family [Actinopolymorpha cephalotaxi]
MQIGTFSSMTDETIDPTGLARAVEERGFESLFVPEHTHIPASRETPYEGGGELPREYYRVLDPVSTLAAAAAVTTTLRLGTAVSLAAQHDPIVLAKQVATLDHLSGGRIEFGAGAGWNREEMRNHGTDPRTRVRLLRERLLAIREIWTREQAEFHGEFVDFDPIFSWPKPVQRPHPPILLGGGGPTTLARVVDHADGWLAPFGLSPGDLAPRMRSLRELAGDAGRPEPTVTATTFGEDPAELAEFADLGVHRVLLFLPAEESAQVLRRLDRLAKLLPEVASAAV